MSSPIFNFPNMPNIPSGFASGLNSGLNSGGKSSGLGIDFQQLLMQAISQTDAMQQKGANAIETGVLGGNITNVEIFSAVKKAELALKMMLQVRNKLLEAYNEIKSMQM